MSTCGVGACTQHVQQRKRRQLLLLILHPLMHAIEAVRRSLREMKAAALLIRRANGRLLRPQRGDGGGDGAVDRFIAGQIDDEVGEQLVLRLNAAVILSRKEEEPLR